jgi:isocitrate dehydrogenase kinase/phosphatase
VLNSAFYRNKGAYVIGKAVNGAFEYPFAIPVLHSPEGKLYLDTVILDAWRISVLFSLSRAYFMVDMEVPSGYVQFLRSIMPNKPRSELYTMLGLGKQGKTMFFRDLIFHLRHSADQFIVAPGIRGLVMLVFHLAVLPLCVQGHQGCIRQFERGRPRHRATQVPVGEAGGSRRSHGRHTGVLQGCLAAQAIFAGTDR